MLPSSLQPFAKAAVDILIANDYSLHVLHISGDENVVDALSCVQFSVALTCVPELKLFAFYPPGLVGLPK